MQMAKSYQLLNGAAMPVPVQPITGRFLAHNRLSRVSRAFIAADLHSGDKALTKPTMLQAALLARVNSAYAWWAEKRQAERPAILRGEIPLVPPHSLAPRTNGNGTSLLPAEIPDHALVDLVRRIGVSKLLDIAVMAEAAE
jgi:hypothetical protein